MKLLQQYYNSRLLHINGNIVFAGLLSTLVVARFIDMLTSWTNTISYIVVLTAVIDAVLDVGIFSWFHRLSTTRATKRHKQRHFVTDVATIQFQRVILSPLYYVLAVTFQGMLLTQGMARAGSVVVAYIGALLLTRIVHTIWGLKTGLFK